MEFNQLAMRNHDGSEDILNRVMPKDDIGLVALLQTKTEAWSQFCEYYYAPSYHFAICWR